MTNIKMTQYQHYIIPDWPAPAQIQAYVTTRQQGHSSPPFDSFNLASHVNDQPSAVTANINQLIEELNLPEPPSWLNQVHGNTVLYIGKHPNTLVDADASFTRERNKVCAILTADCLPILLCNRTGTEVAAIHAGWKGLLAEIIPATIAAMQTPPANLLAWMGPALGPDRFPIGDDIYQRFLNLHPDNKKSFFRKQAQWHLNCYNLGRLQLQRAGVTEIFGGGSCTYENDSHFYSYRRDNKVTGRMASLIFIRDNLNRELLHNMDP